jgi:hypothetical protein
VQLGTRLINEMRAGEVDPPTTGGERSDEPHPDSAMDLLRWGADDIDDDTLWTAALTAAALAADDGERWSLGDGLIDESIAVRASLRRRWAAERHTNVAVAEIYRVMRDPSWNGTGAADSWWANP